MELTTMSMFTAVGVSFNLSVKLKKAIRHRLRLYVNSISLDTKKETLCITYTAYRSDKIERYKIDTINYKIEEYLLSINITLLAQNRDKLGFLLETIELAVHDILRESYGYKGVNGDIFLGLAEQCRKEPEEWEFVAPKHWKEDQVGIIVF